jgi:hypothetical protein
MARALLGYVGSASERMLSVEVARLRRRVAELEAEVAELRAYRATIDLELRDIAEQGQPVLA